MAQNNEYLQTAADSIYEANADARVREQCYYRRLAEKEKNTMRRIKEENDSMRKEIALTKDKLASTEDKLASTEDKLASAEDKLAILQEQIRILKQQLEESDNK